MSSLKSHRLAGLRFRFSGTDHEAAVHLVAGDQIQTSAIQRFTGCSSELGRLEIGWTGRRSRIEVGRWRIEDTPSLEEFRSSLFDSRSSIIELAAVRAPGIVSGSPMFRS